MSAQATSAKKIANYTQSISSNVANLLTELGRASASAVHPAPSTNTNDLILHQLQSMSSEIASIRTTLSVIQTEAHFAREEARPKITAETSLVDLMQLEDTSMFPYATAEEHNELARLYNKTLRHHSDFIAPLHNARNKPVFGFPTTLGDLANLHSTAEELLCSAFGLTNEPNTFANFCGFDTDLISRIVLYHSTGHQLVIMRVMCHNKRESDIAAAGPPTASTRMAAAIHNVEVRRHNAEADCSDYNIMPIHDERNLRVPLFPREWDWFSQPHRRDVLYLLGQYGLDTEPEGCMDRFEAFAGVPRWGEGREREAGRHWFL